MKSNRLPETDLANWSFLPADQKRVALIAHDRPKIILGSYEPFRQVFPDAVNQQFPLFESGLHRTDWDAIQRRLIQECKGDGRLIAMNKAILEATHVYALENGISATPVDVVSLRFDSIHNYLFGLPILMRYRDRASFAFLDLRRSTGLNPNGRRFLFSAMHERFRVAYPDFADVGLEIWRYQNNASRKLVAQQISEIHYSYDDLVRDVRETYEIYDWIRRRGTDERRASGGGAGPLFD